MSEQTNLSRTLAKISAEMADCRKKWKERGIDKLQSRQHCSEEEQMELLKYGYGQAPRHQQVFMDSTMKEQKEEGGRTPK